MKKAILFCLLSILIVSCSENPNDVANVEATEYFPISKGSHWTYSVTDFDKNGNAISISDSEYITVDDFIVILLMNSPSSSGTPKVLA